MPIKAESYIGSVQSLDGGLVSIQLDERVYKSLMPIINGVVYRIGQVGSFIKIPLGYTTLFGVVVQAGVNAIPDRINVTVENLNTQPNYRWLTAALVGEMTRGRFERGVAQFPTAHDEVHLVTIEDLSHVYSDIGNGEIVQIGRISASESLPANINLDKLVTRHCAILGSTGSGKSNTVSVIVDAIASCPNLLSQRIVIIDPHGEYNESLRDISKIFRINADQASGESELTIPYWALPFDEFISLFPGRLSDSQREYVRSEVVKRKMVSAQSLKTPVNPDSITSDSPVPFCIKNLWFDLDDFERQTFSDNGRTQKTVLIATGNPNVLKSNSYPSAAPGGGTPFLNNRAQGILGFLDGMRNRIVDERFKFLFQIGQYEPNANGIVQCDLDELLIEWLEGLKKVAILDLSGVPPEIMSTVTGCVLKIMYDALFWGQNFSVGGRSQPALIVLEEAHNYLKSGEYSIASRTVQGIAKEGRKYGVGLLLVSQRPAELDETILSQCGSVIALRMVNPRDKSHVSSTMQDGLSDLISVLPSLRTGEGIISGEIVKIPSRVKFFKAAYAPKGSDPKVSVEWSKPVPDGKEFQTVVSLWRTGKFK